MTKFYVCDHCKNMVNMVHNSGVPMMCCGQKMTELVPNAVDAATEKHVPEVVVEGNAVKVTVGSVMHPMLDEHHIEWIVVETDKGVYRRNLEVGKEPTATFTLTDEKAIKVYEYCNLHGLWVKKV